MFSSAHIHSYVRRQTRILEHRDQAPFAYTWTQLQLVFEPITSLGAASRSLLLPYSIYYFILFTGFVYTSLHFPFY